MTHDEMIKQREKMAQLATEARAELDKVTDDTTEAEAKELEARFDKAMEEHDKIAARIEREEKLAVAEERAQAGAPPDGRGQGSQRTGRGSAENP